MSAAELSNVQIGTFSIFCMLVLIYAGMPIGLALMLLGFVGIWMMKGNTIVAERTLALAASEFLRNYFFGVVPLFVLMGLAGQRIRHRQGDVRRRTPAPAPAARRSRHSNGGGQRDFRRDNRIVDRLGRHVYPGGHARNVVARLHAALRGRRRGGIVGPRNADPAQPVAHRLRIRRRAIGRHPVRRRHHPGPYPRRCIRAADTGDGEVAAALDRRSGPRDRRGIYRTRFGGRPEAPADLPSGRPGDRRNLRRHFHAH